MPHLVLDVGELGVVLVVLLVLRAVDCRVESSFHGWCLCGDSIANYALPRARRTSFPFGCLNVNLFKDVHGDDPMRHRLVGFFSLHKSCRVVMIRIILV